MAITFVKEKKNIYYLVLLLAIIFVLAVFFIVWRIFFTGPVAVLPQTVSKYSEIKINFEILKSPILKELQPFDEIKPTEEEIGRENPFVSY